MCEAVFKNPALLNFITKYKAVTIKDKKNKLLRLLVVVFACKMNKKC